MAHPGDPNQPDFPQTPWIVIPYWGGVGASADQGRADQRPLPPSPTPGPSANSSVASWACESIRVGGGGPADVFTPDVPTTISIDVRDYGRGSVLDVVIIDLWWAAPTPSFGFVTMNPPMAQAVGALSRDGTGALPPLTSTVEITIEAKYGQHVCLLARATTVADTTPVSPPNPLGDRHWAQRNLHVVTPTGGGKFHLTFNVGNATLASLLDIPQRRVERGATVFELPVTLKPRRRLALTLEGQLARPVAPGHFVAFEVAQIPAGDGEQDAGRERDSGAARDPERDPARGRVRPHRDVAPPAGGSLGVVVLGRRA